MGDLLPAGVKHSDFRPSYFVLLFSSFLVCIFSCVFGYIFSVQVGLKIEGIYYSNLFCLFSILIWAGLFPGNGRAGGLQHLSFFVSLSAKLLSYFWLVIYLINSPKPQLLSFASGFVSHVMFLCLLYALIHWFKERGR